ncbi:MAG: endolytic transglycosylase MltG [Actinomycetota bacterium]
MSDLPPVDGPPNDPGGPVPPPPTAPPVTGADPALSPGQRLSVLERERQRREQWPQEWWEEVPERRFPWMGSSFAILIVVAILGAFVFVGWRTYRWGVEQIDPPGEPVGSVVLTFGDGDTASNIADELEAEGIIPNASVYRWYVRLRGGTGFQAGDYEFQQNSAAWDVIDTLSAGPVQVAQAVTFPILFPEGLTVDEIVDQVQGVGELPYTAFEFEQALRQTDYVSEFAPPPGRVPEGAEPLEGLLFPDTYAVQEGESPALLVERMLRRFDDVGRSLSLNASRDLVGYDPYDVLVIASMIEEEAATPEDRPLIARVIYNRLEVGEPLGIDATVIYATGDNVITVSDLEVESPYNTRRFAGLPPTPIASPGAASIEAALNPAEGDWFYYVRTEEDGSHTFAVTAEEFEAAKLICQERGYCG